MGGLLDITDASIGTQPSIFPMLPIECNKYIVVQCVFEKRISN